MSRSALILSFKERGGSSFQGINKYIAVNYKVDSEKLSQFIKKYLKTAVASGQFCADERQGRLWVVPVGSCQD